jgi:RNA polymerase sigma-32 factor
MSHSRSLVPVTLAVPGVNLGAYITNVNQVAILYSDEERELAERYFYEKI